MTTARLIADIGGTNARFALADSSGAVTAERRLTVADFPDFDRALESYLDDIERPALLGAMIAAAGPVLRGRIKLTNAPWAIEAEAVRAQLGDVPVGLVNDLGAVALALPHLAAEDVTAIRTGRADPEAPRLAVNVGTGFGAALAIRNEGGWRALSGEPGHMSLGVANAVEAEAFAGAGSVEDVLSGRGLGALAARLGSHASTSAEVFAHAREEQAAGEALGHFGRLFGRVAGDLVLASGAWGGVYMTGSVAEAWAREADRAAFLEKFVAKGPMAGLMAEVPVWAITRRDPAFLGLAATALN